MTRRSRLAPPLALLALAASAPVYAQSGGEILEAALEHHAERVAGIDDYTVVQEINGVEQTLHFEKRMVDGYPVFVPRNVRESSVSDDLGPLAWMGGGAGGPDDAPVGAHPFGAFAREADRFRVAGTETLDGHPTWILEADDPGALDLGLEGFTPSAIAFRVDREDYLIRAIHVEGETATDGERRPVSYDVELGDYRDVGGMLHPFRTVLEFEGMGSLSDEERAEMAARMEESKRQMAEMEEQLARMPAAQRKMVEEQMKRMGGMEGMQRQMEALAAGRVEVIVKEVRINQGPPEGGRR